MIVADYVQLCRTETNRDNGILKSLPVAELMKTTAMYLVLLPTCATVVMGFF